VCGLGLGLGVKRSWFWSRDQSLRSWSWTPVLQFKQLQSTVSVTGYGHERSIIQTGHIIIMFSTLNLTLRLTIKLSAATINDPSDFWLLMIWNCRVSSRPSSLAILGRKTGPATVIAVYNSVSRDRARRPFRSLGPAVAVTAWWAVAAVPRFRPDYSSFRSSAPYSKS